MPLLAVPALQKLIAQRRLLPLHLLVGEDVKWVDVLVDAMEATIDEADRPFAVDRLHAGERGGTPVDIAAAARGMAMLGDRRLVFVLRAERLLKPKRGGKAGASDDDDSESEDEALDLGPLEDYIAAPSPATSLIFVATEVDRGRRLTKRLVEKAGVTEFAGLAADVPGGRRDAGVAVPAWLREEFARAGQTIEASAEQMLVSRAGADITKLRGDVERLLLFAQGRPQVVVDDVIAVVTEESAEDPWGIVNAVADGDVARALVETGRRLDRGESPHGLVGQLRWWVSTRLCEGDPARVKPAIDALLRTDLALKSSGGDGRILVERLVVELTGRRLQQRSRW
ncbi:MAG: DNA polymerase III subunit delta [Acidobacteriota bacterium]